MKQGFTLKTGICSACMLMFMLFYGQIANAQASRSTNVGAILFDTNEALSEDALFWPRDLPSAQGESDRFEMLTANSIIVGVRRTWSDPSGVVRDIQIAQIGRSKFSDIELVTPPVPGAFNRTYRNAYPTKIVDGTDWTPIQAKGDPVAASAPADAVIYAHLNTWADIDIERWTYAFASDEHDDYVIQEYVFTNTSSEVMNDVYFGLQSETHASAYYPSDLWGTYYGATYANYVAGDASADSMRAYYSWDGDQTSAQATIDTRAKPDPQWGNFREPQYFGHVVLHVDASATDENDDPAQPIKAGWSQRELAPDLNVAGHEDIYQYLSEGWNLDNDNYSITVDANGDVIPTRDGPYRILNPDVDVNNDTQFDPLTEQEKTSLFSFGPYTLQPGEDVRIVTALVGGMFPYRWAIDLGRAYDNGNPQQFDLVPMPYSISDPFTGEELVSAGAVDIDKETKNRVLDLSQKFFFENASKAIRTWKNGTVRSGIGQFDIPLAPATPSLTATSENDQIRLQWGPEAEMDMNAGPIERYNIYREFNRPAALELPTDTTFLLLDSVPVGGELEYVDTDVVRGEDYYYYVTAVTVDGIESSRFANRTGTADDKVLEAVAPTRSPDPNWKDNVVVVPNPFHIQGAFNYEERRRINFLNLPAFANIHIYTMTGDRIQTLEHDSNTGDQDWERQESFSTLEIVSGIYLYVVEELDGPRGRPTGEQAMGKFVVIK